MKHSPTPACYVLRKTAEDGATSLLAAALSECQPECSGYDNCQALARQPQDLERTIQWMLRTVTALAKSSPSLGPIDRLPVSASLTHRETDVGRLIAEGHSNKVIAHKIATSEHTVKVHVNSIFKKLGVHNRTQAARILASMLSN